MASVSAEASGIVRVALNQISVEPTDGLVQRFSAALEARVARLSNGKRLTERQVDGIKKILDSLTPYRTEVGDWRIYCQSRKMVLTGPNSFTEQLLEIRAMRLDCTRRRVRYDDHPLGLQITFHALARLVERSGQRNNFIQGVLSSAAEMTAFFVALRLGYADDFTFAIPFAGGLAFGETTDQAQLLGTMVYEADDEGSGFTIKDGPTSTELPGGSRLGARISSYLSADQLNPRQDALLKAWQGLREKHANIWQELTDITVCNKNKSSNTLMLQSLGFDVGLLAKSDLWASAIRPSRPALARAAALSSNEA